MDCQENRKNRGELVNLIENKAMQKAVSGKKEMWCPYCGENHTYCIWCGEDLEKGHSLDCPLVYGIKVREGYIALGIEATDDNETNMAIARFGLLSTIQYNNGKTILGPLDPEVKMRLTYEDFSFKLMRLNTELLSLNNQGGFFAKRKIKKLEGERAKLKELAQEDCNNSELSLERKRYWREKIEELYSRGRVQLL